jgi:hypothetical protein
MVMVSLTLIISLVTTNADATNAKPQPAAASKLDCQGKDEHPVDAKIALESLDKDEIYLFAVKTFGAPISCQFKWNVTNTGNFLALVIELKGATFSRTTMPPETGVTELISKSGFPDEKAVRVAAENSVKGDDPKSSWNIDWSKSETSDNARNGTTAQTFWNPEGGYNMGVSFTYNKSKKLISVSRHMAL